MSIVDTWGWDKLKVEAEAEEEHGKDVDTVVRTAVYEFENEFGHFPNIIIAGCNLVDELSRIFIKDIVPIEYLEKFAKAQKCEIKCEYEGIPIKVDYANPNNLEVGYMVKWTENKYLIFHKE